MVDSRETKEGHLIRRRRECLHCKRRFTTYERSEDVPCLVIKKEGRREVFERSKVLGGLLKACEKRPVTVRQMEAIVEEIERKIFSNPERELTSRQIGALLMDRLKEIDQVAYVRFASVYREFKDVKEFMQEIQHLFKT